MTPGILSPVEAREAVHLLILQEFAGLASAQAVILKGGVNLRLFFGSVRYSEDMDLDGEPHLRDAIRGCIRGIFTDNAFLGRLRSIGIRGLDPGEGPNKDTETTFRYKFGVIMQGDIRYPTKVEVSFRVRYAGDLSVTEEPAAKFFDVYDLDPCAVRRYRREAAVRQKIDALGGRSQVQARDVFDLSVLVGAAYDEELLRFIAAGLSTERLNEALDRTYTITFDEYEGRVLEFLSDEDRRRYGSEDNWTDFQLECTELIEAALAVQETS